MTSGAQIVAAVAVAFGVGEAELIGPRKPQPVVEARQALYFLLRVMPKSGGGRRTLPQVAAATRREHSTVKHGITEAEYRMTRQADYVERVAVAGEIIAGILVPPPVAPALVAHVPVKPRRRCKPKNRTLRDDHDARMRKRGTDALAAALAQTGGHR